MKDKYRVKIVTNNQSRKVVWYIQQYNDTYKDWQTVDFDIVFFLGEKVARYMANRAMKKRFSYTPSEKYYDESGKEIKGKK